MAASIPLDQDQIVWCPTCGIPHAAGTAYCSGCSQPLVVNIAGQADQPDADASDGAPPAPEGDDDEQTGALAGALAARVARGHPARQQPSVRWPLKRQPAPLTDEEIEVRAAAIVAQARAQEAAGLDTPAVAGGPTVLDDAEPFAQLDFLPPLRERDRLWLIAGLFCCALLILFAIGFVRFFAK